MPETMVHNRSKSAKAADILKAMAHPIRFRIVAALCMREHNVSQLVKKLGISQAIVSQQLRILRMKRLVEASRSGGFSTYRILDSRLRTLVRCMSSGESKKEVT